MHYFHVIYQAAQTYFGKSKFWGEKTFWEKEDKQVPQADKMSSCHRCHFICFFHKLRRKKKKNRCKRVIGFLIGDLIWWF